MRRKTGVYIFYTFNVMFCISFTPLSNALQKLEYTTWQRLSVAKKPNSFYAGGRDRKFSISTNENNIRIRYRYQITTVQPVYGCCSGGSDWLVSLNRQFRKILIESLSKTRVSFSGHNISFVYCELTDEVMMFPI